MKSEKSRKLKVSKIFRLSDEDLQCMSDIKKILVCRRLNELGDYCSISDTAVIRYSLRVASVFLNARISSSSLIDVEM